MLGVLGVVGYLVDVRLVGAFHEHDVGPSRLEVGDYLDVLVHALWVRYDPSTSVLEGASRIPFVCVCLRIEPAEHEPLVVGHNERRHVLDVLAPQLAVDVPLAVPDGHSREGCEVLAMVGGVHVTFAVLDHAYRCARLGVGEYHVIARNVPELVVGR